MYGKAFCKVYNEFGWNYFPEAFAHKLLDSQDSSAITWFIIAKS